MKRRDFLKLSTQAIAITAAVPVLANVNLKKEPELKPILNDDGTIWYNAWLEGYNSHGITSPSIGLGSNNPLFKGDSPLLSGAYDGIVTTSNNKWTQEQINILTKKRIKALQLNKLRI